jgi:hypothetical protein
MLPPSLYKLRYRDFSTEAVSYNDIQKDLNWSFEINFNTIVQASSGVTLIPIALTTSPMPEFGDLRTPYRPRDVLSFC